MECQLYEVVENVHFVKIWHDSVLKKRVGYAIMDQIELSIIIPIYNGEKYIERCIRSILKSDRTEIEVIAVNDGSRDSSLNICRMLEKEDSRLHVYDKENGGVSSARNLGMDKARGRYVTFCDADDFYENGAITKLVSVLTAADYDLVFFPFYLVTQNASRQVYSVSEFKQTQTIELTYIKDNFWRLLNSGMINSCWNRIFYRERIQNNGLHFRTDMTFSEDGVFNVAYLRQLEDTSKILYIKEPLYNYVSNEGQATRKKIDGYFYMICLAFDNIDAFIGNAGRTNTYWKEWLSVIRATLYHQNYAPYNAQEILLNKRTKEIIEKYRASGLQERFIIHKLKQGNIEKLCVYEKTRRQLIDTLRNILNRKTK